VNTAFGYGVFCLALFLPAPLWLQLLGANVVAVVFTFLTAAWFVFAPRG
jgi:membrane protein implicated in regulation of membrane protease activity